MSTRRAERLSEFIKQEVSKIILYKVKDPRLSFITVTEVDISADLKNVKVYVSVLGNESERKNTLCGLDHAKGFIQTELGSCLRIKYTPHLKFCMDELTEKRNRILKIIDEAVRGSSVIEKNGSEE